MKERYLYMKSRILALLLALALMFGVSAPAKADTSDLGSTPVQLDICSGSISIVSAEDTVTYTQGDNVYTSTGGCVVTQSDTSASSSNRIKVSAGSDNCIVVNLTIAGLNLESENSPIALDGYANVILSLVGDNTVISSNTTYDKKDTAGIRVEKSSRITLQGNGSLYAKGGREGAGIGSGTTGNTGGFITIAGGTITAAGGYLAPGIGGNYKGSAGTIAIIGGVVSATGGQSGAGIGGGCYGDGGNITISGGSVTAVGGDYASGIGGGADRNGGVITISGGSVTATGGQSGAGIGGRNGGTINISGGTVDATGGHCGAGIGGGKKDALGNGGNGGTIIISGGTVTATGKGFAAGIGGGDKGKGGAVSISNAIVTATGKYHAIGGGEEGNEYGCDSIAIGENSTLNLAFTWNSDSSSLCQERIDINTQPVSAAAHAGNSVVFAVDAYGYSGISYQWERSIDGNSWDACVDLASATNVCVTEENASATYRCRITNVYGNTVYTDEVQCYILDFTQQPESVDANLHEAVAFKAVSSCPNVTYQWQRSYDGETWSDITNKNSSSLVVTATHSENGAYYRCVITAANGDWLASDSAQLTVNTDAVTYSTDYYLEQVDGSYACVERITVESETGASVSASEKTFDYYTEDTTKGIHSGTVLADNSLILSRYYTRNEYTLTFEVNNGAVLAPITAKHGTTIALPEASRYGYVFDGWYLNETLTEPAQITTMPTENITVYAKWTAVGADRGIEYHINGITLLGSDYAPVDAIPNGNFYAQVSVTNLCSETVDTLILASYDADGRMIDLYFLYANPQVGQTFILGALIDNSGGEVAELRAFMLPMLGGPMVPLANSASTCD